MWKTDRGCSLPGRMFCFGGLSRNTLPCFPVHQPIVWIPHPGRVQVLLWHGPPSDGWQRLWRNKTRDHLPTSDDGKALSLSSRPCMSELLANHRLPIRTCSKLSNTPSSAGRSRRRGLRSHRRQKLLPRETVRFFKLDTNMHILE